MNECRKALNNYWNPKSKVYKKAFYRVWIEENFDAKEIAKMELSIKLKHGAIKFMKLKPKVPPKVKKMNPLPGSQDWIAKRIERGYLSTGCNEYHIETDTLLKKEALKNREILKKQMKHLEDRQKILGRKTKEQQIFESIFKDIKK